MFSLPAASSAASLRAANRRAFATAAVASSLVYLTIWRAYPLASRTATAGSLSITDTTKKSLVPFWTTVVCARRASGVRSERLSVRRVRRATRGVRARYTRFSAAFSESGRCLNPCQGRSKARLVRVDLAARLVQLRAALGEEHRCQRDEDEAERQDPRAPPQDPQI